MADDAYRRRPVRDWQAVSDSWEAEMGQQALANRMQVLEHRVDSLEKLPDRVDSLEVQIVQLREEMRVEFSAVRAEMSALGTTLRSEMRAGDAETRTLMRVLHDEVLSRIALLGEGRKKPQRSKKAN